MTTSESEAQSISPVRVASELLKRRRIRRTLIEWCRYCGFNPAAHHRLLIDRLERVARGKIQRLAVFMPPGSAKSTYTSILYPPYVMARRPGISILAVSHTTELAEKWGRRARNLITEHNATLGVRFSAEAAATCLRRGESARVASRRRASHRVRSRPLASTHRRDRDRCARRAPRHERGLPAQGRQIELSPQRD